MKSTIMPIEKEIKNHSPNESHSIYPPDCIIGVWENGKYLNIGEDINRHTPLELQILNFRENTEGNKGIHVTFSYCNGFSYERNIKVVFIFHNSQSNPTTAFYSPQEDSIIQFGEDSCTYLSGTIEQKGLGQYSIIESSKLKYEGCFKNIDKGELYFSPLAKGKISIIFTLETNIPPNTKATGAAWAFLSPCRERAAEINHSLRKKPTSILF